MNNTYSESKYFIELMRRRTYAMGTQSAFCILMQKETEASITKNTPPKVTNMYQMSLFSYRLCSYSSLQFA